jgi:hypothetical protein
LEVLPHRRPQRKTRREPFGLGPRLAHTKT